MMKMMMVPADDPFIGRTAIGERSAGFAARSYIPAGSRKPSRRGAKSLLVTGLVLVAAAIAGCSAAESEAQVPLYRDLGTHGYRVTTSSELAQQYFDQGLRLYYAFNHEESVRAFLEAARLDPSCAMCFWGAALAHGPNINAAMEPEAEIAAHGLVEQAIAVSGRASAKERALIATLGVRYSDQPGEGRVALDEAYAEALGKLAASYPDDLEIATLFAEALMDLSPWDYWTPQGEPRARTLVLLAALERVIAANPNHPGACHFFIHAVEAAQPERAVPCADRLAALMPGAGHLVHMPAHIYIRVGRWADAIHANEHAVHADETYIRDQNPGLGLYTAGYYPHNYHFLAFAATMAGQSELAIGAAKKVVETIAPEIAVLAPDLEPLPAYAHLALTTFGRWGEVLALPMPPEQVPGATALAVYARGVAHAATGDIREAQRALAVLSTAAATAQDGLAPVLQIAELALAGEIAHRSGNLAGAESKFRQAAAIEDEMMYMEPPLWYYPIRHSLGNVLLDAGRAAEAETIYLEDLKRFPENGWSLIGLEKSLRAQGRNGDAAEVAKRLQKAWAKADVQPAGSRF